jgi:hypothetical protein
MFMQITTSITYIPWLDCPACCLNCSLYEVDCPHLVLWIAHTIHCGLLTPHDVDCSHPTVGLPNLQGGLPHHTVGLSNLLGIAPTILLDCPTYWGLLPPYCWIAQPSVWIAHTLRLDFSTPDVDCPHDING